MQTQYSTLRIVSLDTLPYFFTSLDEETERISSHLI